MHPLLLEIFKSYRILCICVLNICFPFYIMICALWYVIKFFYTFSHWFLIKYLTKLNRKPELLYRQFFFLENCHLYFSFKRTFLSFQQWKCIRNSQKGYIVKFKQNSLITALYFTKNFVAFFLANTQTKDTIR